MGDQPRLERERLKHAREIFERYLESFGLPTPEEVFMTIEHEENNHDEWWVVCITNKPYGMSFIFPDSSFPHGGLVIDQQSNPQGSDSQA